MVKQMKISNIIFGLLLCLGLTSAAYTGYQSQKIGLVNRAILADQQIQDDDYPYQQKFSAAYDQGRKQDYKHAVQTYGQLLETSPSLHEQAKIQFNIGNNLFVSGLIRRVNDDGSLNDDARYAYAQAKLAYEQSLRLEPMSSIAKFNLSLLHAVMSKNMKPSPKEQSTMELSNLPVGMP
ncbi:MAG: hypothetical protein RIS87_954 [Pseudomonadota bacterium]|jgi:mxaK protein